MSRAPMQWWVRAGNRAYGPYASERLPGFVREGRLTPETSVANDPSGPWWSAGRNPSLGELFAAPPPAPASAASEPPPPSEPWPPTPRRPVAPQGAAAPSVSPRSAPELAPAQAPIAVQPQPQGSQAFVVFAELLDGQEARFAAILGRLGATARARPGVWLLRAAADAAAVRNALSQALGEGESLMVVRAEASDAAWFNLGGEADRALRALWLQPSGRSSRA